MEIKPMIYKTERKREILAHDAYKGYEFAIISLGTHPCAYIDIPRGNDCRLFSGRQGLSEGQCARWMP